MVLVIVLVAIAMLSLAAYTFTELMLSENKAARLVTRQAQARAFTESAAEMMRLYLGQTPQSLLEAGGTYSNVERFQAVPVIDDGTPRGRGRFTVISPLVEQGEVTGVRFGMENESARLNLNTLLFLEQQAAGMNLLAALGSSSGGSSSGGSQSQGNQQSGGEGGNQNQSTGQQGNSDNNSNSNNTSSTGGSTGSARDLLMALPGMTEEIADAILDWIDEDDEPREFGAEIDYYSALGYAPKNGPLDTIEELLLVRGVTPELLFGADANRNGIIDPSEQSRAYLADATSSDREVDRGWAPYLTLYSKEANVRADGTPRIDLNGADLELLHEQLETALNTEWANFIIAYRQFGPYEAPGNDRNQGGNNNDDNQEGNDNPQPTSQHRRSPFQLVNFLQAPQGGQNPSGENGQGSNGRGGRSGGSGGSSSQQLEEVDAGSIDIDFDQPAKVKINQVLDLVGADVRIQIPAPEGSNEQPTQLLVKSPFPDEPGAAASYLPLLMDNVTVNPATTIPGRININQASRVVLQGIPGMDGQTMDALLANRQPEATDENPNRAHETWLYTEGLIDLDTLRAMTPFITGGGSVYRAQIVGYFDQMGPARRVETVIDASNAINCVPRIVFWRDVSNLGRGFGLDTLGTGAVQ